MRIPRKPGSPIQPLKSALAYTPWQQKVASSCKRASLQHCIESCGRFADLDVDADSGAGAAHQDRSCGSQHAAAAAHVQESACSAAETEASCKHGGQETACRPTCIRGTAHSRHSWRRRCSSQSVELTSEGACPPLAGLQLEGLQTGGVHVWRRDVKLMRCQPDGGVRQRLALRNSSGTELTPAVHQELEPNPVACFRCASPRAPGARSGPGRTPAALAPPPHCNVRGVSLWA